MRAGGRQGWSAGWEKGAAPPVKYKTYIDYSLALHVYRLQRYRGVGGPEVSESSG